MRVCEAATLKGDKVIVHAGEGLEEWRLDRERNKGGLGRIVHKMPSS